MEEVAKGHEEGVAWALLADADAVTQTGQVNALGLQEG